MQVLLSGAAGFIGSHLVDRLLQDGHRVLGVDNFITGDAVNLAHLTGAANWSFVQADATSNDFVARMTDLGPFDLVLHLASLASPKDYLAYPLETLESGSTATRNMLEIALRFEARFLITSTSECYGDPLEHPQRESYWGNVNPIGPRSCYDESKRFAEAITMAYHRKYGLRTNIARIFNTYGPRMKLDDGRVVPAFLSQALGAKPLTVFGDGTQTRSFCFVDDMVEGLCRLMLSDEREPVNLGNPQEITLLEFAERIQRMLGTSSPLEFHPLPENDPTRRQPDISKAKRTLSWEPKVNLESGLATTVAYFQGRLAAH
ncbi:UDP-glucuronic acid decarboxylase family protein [Bryobacter aggregatus]|uniref:UDP-glucuronic acid decarboxylase family protein n=1 Tax=Bryobacter aggregatus TaxID=360054 RepID=UPI0004E0C4F6|nr:UDP-glucuronic acid decarboxylase family protein [Bryobacter aggregatus]